MTRSADDVRNEFLEFFRQRRHTIVPGSPVVPYDDPTLLFTNAGMNQFKDVFLATGTRKYTRAADSQPCIRAGGKHNDLDDVGRDTYHHTFFEMLGNWSFGDYFKKEAIEWAWELLTKVWGLDKTRLHATYFEGDESEGLEPDLEAKELWASVTDIDSANIHPGNKKDNFWEMGDVGPCGPCSEIHIDLTPDKSGAALVNAGDARVIEIWNLVFIQFNRDAAGKLTPLPAKHVDTGMGFERVCALLQDKSSNYDTDVFTPIFRKIQDITGAPEYGGAPIVSEAPRVSEEEPRASADEPRASARPAPGTREASNRAPSDEPRGLKPAALPGKSDATRQESGSPQPEQDAPHPESNAHQQNMIDVSYRVIADHARCLTFAINDGCMPDREGRGYVLRRILRRGVWHGWQYLGMREPFLYKLVPAVVDTLGDAFPQLKEKPDQIAEIIREEEEAFLRTLDRGITLFGWAAGTSVLRTFKKQSSRSATLGGPYDLMVRFHRTVGAKAVTVWERGGHYRIESSDRFLLVKHNDQSGHQNPLREFSLDDFSPELFRELGMPQPVLSGADAFTLHDTYGFPIDLTEIIAQGKGLCVDIGEFERLMDQARERARAAQVASASWLEDVIPKRTRGASTSFVGYTQLSVDNATVDYVFAADGTEREAGLQTGEGGVLVLNKTPFYAEAGGQVGDKGVIRGTDSESWEFAVETTQRIGDTYVHIGTCIRGPIQASRFGSPSGPRAEGALLPQVHASRWVTATAEVTESVRRDTMQNHTATHVMNWALREMLGDHVQQKGSLVDPEKTRFDFLHNKALAPDEIERVEQLVNDKIAQNLTVYDKPVPQEQALKIHGLRAVFGEKYPDVVRVLSIGTPVEELVKKPDDPEWRNTSIEFCGGTHVKSTGEIEHFAIVSEEAVAKGIRRVVGVTGTKAQRAIERGAELLKQVDAAQVAELQQTIADSTLRVVDRAKLRDAVSELQKIIKKQQKQQAAAAKDIVADKVDELLKDAPKVGDTTIVVAEMPDLPLDQLKTGADTIKQKCGSAAVLFGVWVNRPSEPEAQTKVPSEPEAQTRVPSEPEAQAGPRQGPAPGRDEQRPDQAWPQVRRPGQSDRPDRKRRRRRPAHHGPSRRKRPGQNPRSPRRGPEVDRGKAVLEPTSPDNSVRRAKARVFSGRGYPPGNFRSSR